MALFKYLTQQQHVRSFTDKGHIWLRPLSYFRAIEDREVRGDTRDGVLDYAPETGIKITEQDGTILVLKGWRFTSSVKEDDIFAFCASRVLSPKIAKRFGASFCVEIIDESKLITRLKARTHATSRLDYSMLVSGAVDYREVDVEPDVDWALPERLVFIKPASFAWQDEFRIAVPRRGAFNIENVDCMLSADDSSIPMKKSTNRGFCVSLGELSGICRIHHF